MPALHALLMGLAATALLAALPGPAAAAAERVALVIGNAAYEHTAPLLNPRNDATDLARALERLGFEVIEGLDLDEAAFGSKLVEFARAARGAEVTFREWDACRRGGGCSHIPGDRGWGRGNRPVVNVSWNDAQQYVRWLSRETGKRYRLPSESEWEYVARAGTGTLYHWGDPIARNRANCDGCGSAWDNDRTAPAGSFSPNAFGLHDVHGNVWEWVQDCWHPGYAGAPRDGGARTTGGDCSRRLLRGGSWNSNPIFLRSANRSSFPARSRFNFVGIRVARTLD